SNFPLPVAMVSSAAICEFNAEPASVIRSFIHSGAPDTAAICIHPEMLTEWHGPIPTFSISAMPTASGRTVLINTNEGAMFTKLHFARRLGRLDRHLSMKRVSGAVQVSAELRRLVTHRVLDSSVAFLPESVGLVLLGKQEFGV